MSDDITVEITMNSFRRIGAQMAARIDTEVSKSAEAILAGATLAIQNPPKTGKVYKHGKVTHQASAPGEAPATDTGNLAASGTIRRVELGHYQVVFSTPYAAALEFGNAAGTILPRPYVRPSANAEEPNLTDNIKNVMGKAH